MLLLKRKFLIPWYNENTQDDIMIWKHVGNMMIYFNYGVEQDLYLMVIIKYDVN